MIRVDRLTTPYLPPASLTIEDGQCLALCGASGAGKSVLLRAIADLDPCLGQIWLDGRERSAYSGPHWRAMVGYVPAIPGWWDDRVAPHFLNWNTLSPMLSVLGLSAQMGSMAVADLSTGERQRLALLRALERRPRVLLLDEPTAGLDDANVRAVERLIAEQQAVGMSLLWVTHDRTQAERVAHSHLTMLPGGILQ